MKNSRLIFIFVAISTVLLINYSTAIKQWFQLCRLKSLKCPEIREECQNLFWLHRVNSTDKFEQLKSSFNGFETDVTYVDSLRAFYVFHPNSDDVPLELSWADFLNTVEHENKMWYIDLRGITGQNVAEGIEIFEATIENIILFKRQALLELYDYNAALAFQAAGYNVSLNYEILQSLISSDDNLADSILHKIESITQICGDGSLLEEMKKNFPGKKYLIWELSYKNYLDTERLRSRMNDKDVLLILVSVSS